MDDKIIVYTTFQDPLEANIVMTRLKDAGFNCFLSGESTAGLRTFFDPSISGIQLHVFENEADEISKFLADDVIL
ncbi:DUF2007 domain-containing protein [Pedobacter polaris]|uniref:DUF2007 domain-containing protein n=1 Tax=Pedobacter polaris TaxID=2571273 RepID=A0A4U1CFR8_9SPHI|nr:DUF2007 domain-containing protein [Pedobacter polaris]TKC05479.1 DUF2007 domain-containing protein [Pedobacter polaris]